MTTLAAPSRVINVRSCTKEDRQHYENGRKEWGSFSTSSFRDMRNGSVVDSKDANSIVGGENFPLFFLLLDIMLKTRQSPLLPNVFRFFLSTSNGDRATGRLIILRWATGRPGDRESNKPALGDWTTGQATTTLYLYLTSQHFFHLLILVVIVIHIIFILPLLTLLFHIVLALQSTVDEGKEVQSPFLNRI
jgi:hypothetical protein